MTVISADALDLTFETNDGPVHALKGVSLDIAKGDFVSFIGPSGCGKTTFLRCMADLEQPTGGTITVNGVSPEAARMARAYGYVFQAAGLYPWRTIGRNFSLPLEIMGYSQADQAERVGRVLELVELAGFEKKFPWQLSGGMQQRVALARCLANEPDVILMDEPLGALDKQLREQMQLELRALQRQIGITFVFVTHDQEEALTLSDRIAVMSAGKVLQVDTPSGLYETPHTREVASFIGYMNFFNGTVRRNGAAMGAIETEGLGTIPVPVEQLTKPNGAPVQVALRPEKFSLSGDKPKSDIAIPGTLDTLAYLGERSHYYIKIDGKDEPVSVSTPNFARAGGEQASGAPMWLSFNPEAIVVLDAD